jgi:hypothetical protein
MERKLSAGYAGLLFLAFAFISFPGGAILMALSCNSRRQGSPTTASAENES